VDRVFLNHIQSGEIKESNSFLYLNQDIELTSRLNVNAGLRYDYLSFGYKDLLAGQQVLQKNRKELLARK
jgi:outer membrane receptor protein involved in Fe transport